MPKSRHRKNHKEKVAHYKLMQKHKKRAQQRKLQELYNQELMKVLEEYQKNEGEGGSNPIKGLE